LFIYVTYDVDLNGEYEFVFVLCVYVLGVCGVVVLCVFYALGV